MLIASLLSSIGSQEERLPNFYLVKERLGEAADQITNAAAASKLANITHAAAAIPWMFVRSFEGEREEKEGEERGMLLASHAAV